jgi:hypothetical protein
MKRKTLVILTLAAAAVAMGSGLVWTQPVEAWPSVCDNCYVGLSQYGDITAECCLDGQARCDMLEDMEYTKTQSNMEYCVPVIGATFAYCDGQLGCSASGGGPGGGSGSCTIPYGDMCPAECMSCSYYYY